MRPIPRWQTPYAIGRKHVPRFPCSSASRIELLAPFCISDLVTLDANPTPALANKLCVHRARVTQKHWVQRWPNLRINDIRD
jgi:hypothetical protein